MIIESFLIPETQQLIRPHNNFMLFATQNPPGMYGGRKTLSRAFRNRFLELHFSDIPEDELETILRERSQIAPSFCSRIVTVYKQLSVLRQRDRLFEQRGSFATFKRPVPLGIARRRQSRTACIERISAISRASTQPRRTDGRERNYRECNEGQDR